MPTRGYTLVGGLVVGFATVATLFVAGRLRSARSPEQVAEAFFHETYTHDFAAAWELVSAADQAARSKQEYLAANGELNPAQAALYEQLASWGEYQVIALASNRADHATVTARIRYPNNALPEFVELVERAGQTGADAELIGRLQDLQLKDQLQFIEGDIGFDLVREDNRWRVQQHWGQSVSVLLSAVVSPGLPWEFYPIEGEIVALPGALVRADYVARNDSDRAITGKAVHLVGPPEAAGYIQTIECFCFTEQTLAAGEERQMSLLFRIDPSLPRGVPVLYNRYTFYSLGEFPDDEQPPAP